MPDFKADRQEAARWAHDLIQHSNWCILDTETTGLDGNDQICQIAAINSVGEILINTLVKPTVPISLEASRIHGITNEMVSQERKFPEVFLEMWHAVGERQVVIYNAAFDMRLIYQSLKAWGLPWWFQYRDRKVAGSDKNPIRRCTPDWVSGNTVHCAMEWYAQWCGDWSDYHQSYTWQPLPGGDHTALGDCMATLEVIRRMAASVKSDEPA